MSDVERTSPESLGQMNRRMCYDNTYLPASALNFIQGEVERRMMATAQMYCRGVFSGLEITCLRDEDDDLRYNCRCTPGLGVSSGTSDQSRRLIQVDETISVEFDGEDLEGLLLLKTDFRRQGTVHSAEGGSTGYSEYHLVEPTIEIIDEDDRGAEDGIVLGRISPPSRESFPGIDTSSQYRERAFPLWYPIGTILSYGGDDWHNDKSIPGWYLCDGTNGTPDLRNRFLMGSDSAGRGGGANSRALTTANLPRHSHTASCSEDGAHIHTYRASLRNNPINHGLYDPVSSAGIDFRDYNTSAAGEHDHTISVGSTGSGSSFDNRPAYYSVVYIMRRN